MTFARIVAVVAVLAASSAFAAVKHPAKKKPPAVKHAHTVAAKKTTPAKKKAAVDRAIASAPAHQTRSDDSTRLAQADTGESRDTEREAQDSDVAPSGNRRVITHSTAAPQSDKAE